MKREYILDKQEQLGIQDKMAMLASLQAELKINVEERNEN